MPAYFKINLRLAVIIHFKYISSISFVLDFYIGQTKA